jgi:hypothetical protein
MCVCNTFRREIQILSNGYRKYVFVCVHGAQVTSLFKSNINFTMVPLNKRRLNEPLAKLLSYIKISEL